MTFEFLDCSSANGIIYRVQYVRARRDIYVLLLLLLLLNSFLFIIGVTRVPLANNIVGR